MEFLLLLTIPFLVALGFFVFTKGTITLKEFLIHVGVQMLVAGISVWNIYDSNTGDYEVWAGKVINKKRQRVSCSHSYQCHCRTVRTCSGGKTRTCTSSRVCQTCYEHSYDVSWFVYSSLDTRTSIGRVDRRGLRQPPRWTAVKIGEPWFETRKYTNYVKGASSTLFKHHGTSKKLLGQVPEYPGRVYDYYRINRATKSGKVNVNLHEWNHDLQELNSRVGPRKQAVVLVLFTNGQSKDYIYALKQAWTGAKKNDVVVVIDTDGKNVNWIETLSWSKSTYFDIVLKDELNEIKVLDRLSILTTIENNIMKNFKRRSMKDFEYLKYDIKPTTSQLMWSLAIGLLISIGLGIFFHREDL